MVVGGASCERRRREDDEYEASGLNEEVGIR